MFKQLVFSKYQILSKDWSNETYWTCFAFQDETPDELHCTHKFFGEQDLGVLEDIKKVIKEYFEAFPFTAIQACFDTEEFFGENKDVRVLRLAEDEDIEKFHLDLRAKLDAFATDRFPEYKPHVTTDLPLVEKPLTRYCLCQGDKILHEWRAGNNVI